LWQSSSSFHFTVFIDNVSFFLSFHPALSEHGCNCFCFPLLLMLVRICGIKC
jgi:hypothetical protein